MTNYTSDNWVKLKITRKDGEVSHKILCGTSGGYTTGDSWRLSSEPQSMEEEGDYLVFTTLSGSKYHCHKGSQCVRMNCSHIIHELREHDLVKEVEVVHIEYTLGGNP